MKEFLEDNYPYDHVDYQTIAGFACKLCRTPAPNYGTLNERLNEMFFSDSFPYKHIIVDEGQDFGIDDIEEGSILDTLKTIVEDRGTFYVFYDKLQLIQAQKMPSFIEDADCKLTLYRNCRNTENIATTSLRPISDRKPKLYDNAIKGAPAKIYYCSENQMINKLNEVLDKYVTEGYKDIVILTVKGESESDLYSLQKNGKYRNRFVFSTCRKFKGLEADVVILIDVDASTFTDKNVLRFYVGASRARTRLEIITQLSDEDCQTILQNMLHQDRAVKFPKRKLASSLNAVASV